MKKYIIPSMEVVNIDIENTILTASTKKPNEISQMFDYDEDAEQI